MLIGVRELYERIGVSAEGKARLREDMQRNVALALSSPDEAIALLEPHRRKE